MGHSPDFRKNAQQVKSVKWYLLFKLNHYTVCSRNDSGACRAWLCLGWTPPAGDGEMLHLVYGRERDTPVDTAIRAAIGVMDGSHGLGHTDARAHRLRPHDREDFQQRWGGVCDIDNGTCVPRPERLEGATDRVVGRWTGSRAQGR